MALSSREKSMVLVLPLAGVFAVYGLFWFRFDIARLNQTRRMADAARTAAPSPDALLAQQTRLGAAIREVEQATQELEAAKAQWRAAAGKGGEVPSRPVRIERFNQLLLRSGLHVIDTDDAAGSRDGRQFPSAEVLAHDLGELADDQQPRARVVHFFGQYTDVAATLAALARGEAMAVPLGLTMTGSEAETAWREWTLLVWV